MYSIVKWVFSYICIGIAHLVFKKSGNHYTWRKVTTTVHNIIVGKLWVDNHGEMDITNHKTKDICHLKYAAYSYFSRETPRKVSQNFLKCCFIKVMIIYYAPLWKKEAYCFAPFTQSVCRPVDVCSISFDPFAWKLRIFIQWMFLGSRWPLFIIR